ncbi:piggyBac transposable element-derived protein 3-like [Melitaea cinxia]|uniref:piggyBac transposable element-derived protein 3-like n=1 Tax=Melitaea cinxia TaxID=113334 RepID=UPI001E273B58|nr:piggyBac transposable element-derived protein 3-like [Melitaea cinxia]
MASMESRSGQRMRGGSRGRTRSTIKSCAWACKSAYSTCLSTRSSPSLRRNISRQEQQEDNWASDQFVPETLNFTVPAYSHVDTTDWEWHRYYDQYINDEILLTIVENTNRTHILETGKSLGLTLKELKIYLGITMIMSALQYPQIDMYWSPKWKLPAISMAMNRNRFYFIRKRLKCVYDPDVTVEQKKEKTWKIKPLFQCILKGCHMQERPKDLCIDEMIIPFSGKCPMRQYCPNKPNPVGLKVFVLAFPQGVVCDMVIYQGDTTFPDLKNQGFGLGESAILYLTRTLVPGHSLFFDRYFTSVKLCDELVKLGFHGTGTIMKNRIPRDCVLKEERSFKKEQRGSTEVKIREDGKLAVTMWLDNKPVLMMSSCFSNDKVDECERWSKKDKRYEKVRRREVIKIYNQNMGGVDLMDRMLSVCPSRNRTKKWTIRVISHLFDLCVVNAWLQYRREATQNLTLVKNIMQLRQYKLELGTKLITDNENQSDEETDRVYEELEPKHKKRKVLIKPIPTLECRVQKAAHLPK